MLLPAEEVSSVSEFTFLHAFLKANHVHILFNLLLFDFLFLVVFFRILLLNICFGCFKLTGWAINWKFWHIIFVLRLLGRLLLLEFLIIRIFVVFTILLLLVRVFVLVLVWVKTTHVQQVSTAILK